MEQVSSNAQDMIDTTDSLEAISGAKSMKNFLFFMILVGLLVPQIIFWMDRTGLIEESGCCSKCAGCSEGCRQTDCPTVESKPQVNMPDNGSQLGPISLAAVTNIEEEVKAATDEMNKTQQTSEPVPAEPDMAAGEKPQPAKKDAESEETAPAETEPGEKIDLRLPCSAARILVAVSNFIVLLATVLYSLTLLICLKISLTGRLGGINHITRAFFLSLYLWVILIPWQQLLPRVLLGTVWMPGELLCGGWSKADSSTIWKVLFYLRFCGLWFVALWFLLCAQIRSAKWAQATLRRLGIVK